MRDLLTRLRDKTRMRKYFGLTGIILAEEVLTEEAADRIADLEQQVVKMRNSYKIMEKVYKARLAEAHEVLAECREYFYERADAEYFTDSPEPVGNEEMTLLCMIEDVAIGRSATAPESAGSPESPKE